MELLRKIQDDTKVAMRSGNVSLISVLRMLSAAIHNKEIEKRTKLAKEGKASEALTDEEVLGAVMSEAKKRREAIEGFEKGGRIDLVEKERKELGILETYLPLQLSDEEIQKEIDGAVKAVGASSTKDVGKVMAYLGARLKGKADMGLVSKKVASKLAAGT